MMETLTQEMAGKAWAIIEEVEAMGGMTKAVASGWAKLQDRGERGAEAGARSTRARDVIVGVNKYRLAKEDPVDIRRGRQHSGARGAGRAPGSRSAPARRRQR